eukprot:TRINITY_DN419_c0_g1_i4.p1 TRINITY_DN419_c0_g1~~TRINITY_DN419_c0_g1_i4.p1  ORF type:complete len:573 (+),score=38.09 TRINITY_DN419_c0_g1_i4:189-1907(+)
MRKFTFSALLCAVCLSCLPFYGHASVMSLDLPTSEDIGMEAFEQLLKTEHEPRPSTFQLLMEQQHGVDGARRKLLGGLPGMHDWIGASEDEILEDDSFERSSSSDDTLASSSPRRKLLGSAYPFAKGLKPPDPTWGPTQATTNITVYRWASVTALNYVDWRLMKAVTGVHDQGTCANCWAVASADAISLLNLLMGKHHFTGAVLNSMTSATSYNMPGVGSWKSTGTQWSWQDASPQQICDCALSGDCCSGGWPEWAMSFAASLGGLVSSYDYPYQGRAGTCYLLNGVTMSPSMLTTGWEAVPAHSVTKLLLAVSQLPVIAFIASGSPAFQQYTGGLFTGPCSSDLDHVVLIVGYGTDATYGPYWIIKNSWGSAWGVGGYMYLQMLTDKGLCGIQSVPAFYPTYIAPANQNPCGFLPNPCGAGTCYVQKIGSQQIGRCGCPAGYVESTLQYPAKCVPYDPCTLTGNNPCGTGTCESLKDGNYKCKCPKNSIVGASTHGGASTCVNASSSAAISLYQTNTGDTCGSISLSYNMLVGTFSSQNKFVDCSSASNPVPPGTVVALTTTPVTYGCVAN